jgi:membrane protease YdiL (CAAX protease family)
MAVAVVLAVVAAVNLGEKGHDGATIAAYVMFAATALFVSLATVMGAARLATPDTRGAIGAGVEAAAGIVGTLALMPTARRAVAGLLPLFRAESPVHAVALAYYLQVLLFLVGSQIAVDQVKATSEGGSPSIAFIIGTNQLPMALVSVVGVGLFVRRSPGQALARLGLYWPGWRWILASVPVVLLLLVAGIGFDSLMARLTPEQNQEILKSTEALFKNADNVIGFTIIGLAAGIGEELFFRGALQPRFGILGASLLFAALHTQYGFTIATAEIFFIGLVLGVVRKRGGTVPAILAHAGYDVVVGLLPFVLR